MRNWLGGKETLKVVVICAVSLVAGFLLSGTGFAGQVSITEDNMMQLKGDWEGSRNGIWKGRDGSGPVTMKVMSVKPFGAKLLFNETASGQILSYGFRGELKDGCIEGEMKGEGKPSLKLILYRKDDGKLELRGEYSSTRNFRGEFKLEKTASQ